MDERVRNASREPAGEERVTPDRHPAGPLGWLTAGGNGAVSRLLRSAKEDPGDVPPGFAARLRGAGGGAPLPPAVGDSLEAGLGVSLDSVRLHVGPDSAAMSDQVGAHAFTVGQDVHFARGAYDPASERGYHLLAHEVAHTLQPDPGAPAGSLTVGPGDSPAEREAEAIATRLTGQRNVAGPAGTAPATGGGGGSTVVRRFGRDEHKALGDAAYADIDLGNGLVLTWGDVVSLAGDEYGSVADLQAAASTPQGIAELRRIMASDDNHSAQYVDLAMHNIPHFAGGGTAMATWSSHHESALLTALLSGLDDSEQEWQQAQLTEAFGQHFLTDSFSAGHVRTPRIDIVNWYQDQFAPIALPRMLQWARNWIRTELVKQIGAQVLMPDSIIDTFLDELMGAALYFLDDYIREKFQPLVGLGISGAISGAMHDRDNVRGLWVASEAHPDPWLAYGDGKLKCAPESAAQAELAVITAREQLVQAQALGRTRREQHGVVAQTSRATNEVPSSVHFALDSAALDGPTITALNQAAEFLTAHSEQVVDITGHTCPLGADTYNDALGRRRAEAVATYLASRGIAADRLHTASAGEHQLLDAEKTGFPLDRRAELYYRAAGDAPTDMVWAQQILAERLPGPPYADVEQYVPHEAPGINDPQEDWHWGTMSSEMASDVDGWIQGYAKEKVAEIGADDVLKDRTIPFRDLLGWTTVTVRPRKPVQDLLNQLLADGTGMLGQFVGIPAANHSVPPLPPPVACPVP